MVKHNQDGAVNGLVISLIFAILLIIGAGGFGAWAYMGRQDYKNNSDAKAAAAVTAAKSQEDKVKDAQFAEAAKQPLRTYQGPEAYGSLMVNFPKTWSGYVDASGTGSALVDGYFAPGVVPSATSQNSVFALRVQVLNQQYAQVLQSFSGQQQGGKLTIGAYALPKLPKVVGVKAVGQIGGQNQASVTMIILPLRSQTLEISTQGNQYLDDFNNNILPNFSFSP
jgi:multidrug efflux pump subunit AcrA (membrane-fusion protein)